MINPEYFYFHHILDILPDSLKIFHLRYLFPFGKMLLYFHWVNDNDFLK